MLKHVMFVGCMSPRGTPVEPLCGRDTNRIQLPERASVYLGRFISTDVATYIPVMITG